MHLVPWNGYKIAIYFSQNFGTEFRRIGLGQWTTREALATAISENMYDVCELKQLQLEYQVLSH